MYDRYYLYLPADYASKVLATSPVAYWKMDEKSGNLVDATGNGWTATVTGSPTYGVSGPSVPATTGIDFSGTGQYATISSSLGTPTDDMTVMAWFNLAGSSGNHDLISRGATDQYSWTLRPQGGYPYATLYQSDGTTHATAGVDNGGSFGSTWHWMAMTWDDGATLTTYYDDLTPATDTSFAGSWHKASTASPAIGAINVDVTPAFLLDGSVCHIAIWHRILTSGELTTMRTGA